MIFKIYRFICDDCKVTAEYSDKDEPRKWGWAISRGGKNCYCPSCAFKHRSTGCKGFSAQNNVQLSISGE